MTIGKKLYAGFGLLLGGLLILFIVNILAGWKESSARKDASLALDGVRTVEAVRYQIMLNRLNMNNFLLSGDPRDEEKVNKGLADIVDQIKRGESNASSEAVRTALIQVESTETSWADNFAKPSSPSAIKWIQATLLFPTCKFFTCRKIPLLADKIFSRSGPKQRRHH